MNSSEVGFHKQRRLKVVFILSILALSAACIPYVSKYYSIYTSQIFNKPIQALTLQLISAPERYDGAFVTSLGWCVVDFEHTTIQMSPDPARWNDAIWLELNEAQITSIDAPEPKFCRVRGTFRNGWSGHMGRWPAQVSPIEDIVIYDEQPKE